MKWFKKKNKVNKSLLFTQVIGSNPVILYNYDQEDFIKKGYASNLEIYSIIKKLTDKCAVATPYVYLDKQGVKYRKSPKTSIQNVAKSRLSIHKALDYAPDSLDLAKLLKDPNELDTWRDLITLFRIYYFVQGEAFLFRESGDNDCAISLNVAPPHRMQPVLTETEITGWKLELLNGKTRHLDANDVLHFKMPNPDYSNNIRGMSPLLAGLKYLQLDDKAIESWIKSMENEGAKGIISPNHNNVDLWLTPDQVEKTEINVQEKIHGSANRNRVVVSGMPLQYTQIGLSPDALNIIKGLEYSSYKLCDLWGVPSALFDPNPTYQNQKSASERFVKEVILPYLNAEEDKLNKWLVEPFNKRDKNNYVIDYDLSSYEELRLNAEDVDSFLKTHSINEVRVMQGSDEIEEEYANQVLIQNGLVPLSDYSIDI